MRNIKDIGLKNINIRVNEHKAFIDLEDLEAIFQASLDKALLIEDKRIYKEMKQMFEYLRKESIAEHYSRKPN